MAYDWSKGVGGATGGAVAGGTIGGPVGAGIGGVLGLLGGFGGKDKMKKIPTMTKDQMNLLSQISNMLGPEGQLGQGQTSSLDLLRQYLDPSSEAVNQFTQPYMQEFEQQTIPGLAERFAGMGGGMGGGLSSSGFGQSLSAAGSNLQTQLAALKAGLGQSAAQQMMSQYGSMSGQALGAQPFGYQKPQKSAMSGFMNSWGKAGFPGASDAASSTGDWLQDMVVKYAGI